MQAKAAPAGVLIAEAAERPSDDPIFTFHRDAVRRAEAGESIVDATLGALFDDDGRLAVLPTVAEAIRRVPIERAAAYAPIAGAPAFLRAVADDVLGAAGRAGDAVVAATPGGTGAIHHAFWNFLEAGHAALAPDYLWGPYRVIAKHAGRALDTFNTFGADDAFDVAAMEAALDGQLRSQGRALVILNYPCNNPTGYSLDADEWAAVAEVLARAGRKAPVAVLLDRAYERFAPGGTDEWLGVLPQLLESTTVLVAWTASKSFTQYGTRVGALLALHDDAGVRGKLQNALNYSCRATWSNCNHLGMLAVTDLLTDPDLVRRVSAEREAFVRLLDERVDAFNASASAAGLRYPRYEGGFFVSVFTPDGPATAAAMRDEGVYVVPLQGAVRVALCATPVTVVPRLVKSLAGAMAGVAADR